MKKTWVWIFFAAIIIFFILGYLHQQGYLKTNWQWLSIILAAAAGPFEFIRKLFTGETASIKQLNEKQRRRLDLEKKHRIYYDRIIKQKEQRIQELEAEIQHLQDKIDALQLELQSVHSSVENMTTNEIQDEFIKYYGQE